jgi:hypothetical protein
MAGHDSQLSTPSGLSDKFSEWQQVYEEQAFKSALPVVEVIQARLSYQKYMLSCLEL